MNAEELRRYIYKNDLTEKILNEIGCHSIVPYSNELRCALPGDSDNSKVSIFLNENMGVRIFTRGETVYGSIIDLVMFIYEIEFKEAHRKCLNILGVSSTYKANKKNDPLDFFKRIKRTSVNKEHETKEYDIDILDKYSKTPHIDLVRKDGLLQDVIDKYNIRFDDESGRIIFPHFKHDDKSKIVGLIGRTTNPAYKELKIPKYFSMNGIKYEKSRNFYGMSHNIDEINKHKQVIVFESEKSVMKADMFGYPIGVSVGCHDLSDWQKKKLISLDVEIIIAFDQDVDLEHIENICNELSMFRSVSYIRDKWGRLLREKDSPVDRGKKKWDFLFKHRVSV